MCGRTPLLTGTVLRDAPDGFSLRDDFRVAHKRGKDCFSRRNHRLGTVGCDNCAGAVWAPYGRRLECSSFLSRLAALIQAQHAVMFPTFAATRRKAETLCRF